LDAEISTGFEGSGKYFRRAHILSIHGIKWFKSTLHQAPDKKPVAGLAFFVGCPAPYFYRGLCPLTPPRRKAPAANAAFVGC
jgi:hypothetical protein